MAIEDTKARQAQIARWLREYAQDFGRDDGGFDDCDMIDSCLHDLDLTLDEPSRRLAGRMVDEWIAAH